MNLHSVDSDIDKLETALKIIEGTENFLSFKKSTLILHICEEINVLRDKKDKQLDHLKSFR